MSFHQLRFPWLRRLLTGAMHGTLLHSLNYVISWLLWATIITGALLQQPVRLRRWQEKTIPLPKQSAPISMQELKRASFFSEFPGTDMTGLSKAEEENLLQRGKQPPGHIRHPSSLQMIILKYSILRQRFHMFAIQPQPAGARCGSRTGRACRQSTTFHIPVIS